MRAARFCVWGPMQYFTVEEANALLPEIRPIMADLLERRARVAVARGQLKPVIGDRWSNQVAPKRPPLSVNLSPLNG